MANIDLPVLSLGAAALGVVSHHAWFIHGLHDFYGRYYVTLWSLFQATVFFALTRVLGVTVANAIFIQSAVSASYLVGLFTSITIYRVFFHKLRRFPGPFSWKLTKLAQVAANVDAKGYLHLDDLHKKYGKIIRIGPNELSITDPAAPPLVLGPGSKCIKGVWYDVGKPLVSMHQCRDKKVHDARRRTWDKGFNAKCKRLSRGGTCRNTDTFQLYVTTKPVLASMLIP